MADNTTLDTGSGGDAVVTREITHGGDTAKLAGSFLVGISGSEGSYTWAAIDGTTANGLEVDVTRVQGSVAVTNAGTFVVQEDGAALTALQLLDDAVYTDGTGTPSKGYAVMGTDGTNPQLLSCGTDGVLDVDIASSVALDVSAATVTVTASSLDTIAGAVSGSEMQVDLVAWPIGFHSTSIGDNGGPGNYTHDCAAFSMVYDGVTWDRLRGDSTNGALVNLGTNNDVSVNDWVSGGGTEATALRVTIANDSTGVVSVDDNGGTLTVDGTVTANLGATDNAVLDNIDTATTDLPNVIGTDGSAGPTKAISIAGTESDGTLQEVRVDSDGHMQADVLNTVTVDGSGVTQPVSGTVTANLSATDNAVLDNIQTAVELIDNAISGTEMQVDVVGALPAGTNAIGKLAANSGVDIGDVDILSIAAGSNLIGDVGMGVRTSGGCSIFRSIDLDESEEEVKGSAGQVYKIHCMNLANAVRYLKFYNATAASVTVGTTTPVLTYPIPTQGDTNGAGFNISIPNGLAFSTAITVAATTGVADSDTGAPGANEVILNLGYA